MILLIVLSALLIVVHSDVQLALGGLSLISLTLLAFSRRRSMPRATWPVLFCSLWLDGPFLQTVSLLMSWLEVISPQSASLYLAYEPNRTWAPLSVAPIATQQAVIPHFTIAVTMLLVVFHGRRHATVISWSIILTGSLCTHRIRTYPLGCSPNLWRL